MFTNVHLSGFKELVDELKSSDEVATSATPLVLLRGGEDTADGKQTGCALCPGSGSEYLKHHGLLLQREP